MPVRSECRISIIKSEVDLESFNLLPLALNDYGECKELLAQNNDSEFLQRAMVRTIIVFFEAWYSAVTYFVETQIEIQHFQEGLISLQPSNNVAKRWMNLELSLTEQELIIESQKDNINPKKLRKSIKLLEKILKIKESFSFEMDNRWISIVKIFNRRNDFTHPKEAKNFDVFDIYRVLPNAFLMTEHLWKIYLVIRDVVIVVKFEHCKENCSCDFWKQDGREDEYNQAKKRLIATQP